MKPQRKKRLFAILGTLAGVAVIVSLVLFSLSENLNLFYTPSEVFAGKAPQQKTIKVGGLVVPGSVKRGNNLIDVSFEITDNKQKMTVHFDDVLPDLFKEGQGIVATGKLMANGEFKASSVLAKHDENYMPPEVARKLEEAGHPVKKPTK
jgi:cytochrome c-type biogenesis protein CcmE